jgi:hypothetical protein
LQRYLKITDAVVQEEFQQYQVRQARGAEQPEGA